MARYRARARVRIWGFNMQEIKGTGERGKRGLIFFVRDRDSALPKEEQEWGRRTRLFFR
jgi:hypothetical protein